MTIGNSVTSIGKYAFYGCSGLKSVTIPKSITSIGEGVFAWCSGLTSITIPNSVKTIDTDAFYECGALTSVTIPNSVTSIGHYAFYKCTGLTSVTIGNSVTSIGYGAFYGCTGLTSITIPSSVTSIGQYAFTDCTFNEVVCEATTPPEIVVSGGFEPSAFSYETYNNVPLLVPAASIPLYEEAYDWRYFKNIIGYDSSGIDEVEADGTTDGAIAPEADVEVYSLQGMLLYQGRWSEARLSKGFYLVRQGNITRKTYVNSSN